MTLDLIKPKIETNPGKKKEPKVNVCSCNCCYGTFRISRCEFEYDDIDYNYQDGQRYGCHLCPTCEYGGEITDYRYSRTVAVTDFLRRMLSTLTLKRK